MNSREESIKITQSIFCSKKKFLSVVEHTSIALVIRDYDVFIYKKYTSHFLLWHFEIVIKFRILFARNGSIILCINIISKPDIMTFGRLIHGEIYYV
jgi:hypothetical protein